MKYVEQSAHKLMFYLLEGAPKTNLESLDRGCAEKSNICVESNIIGASDYSIFTFGEFIFSAVCACIPLSKAEDVLSLIKFKNSCTGNLSRVLEIETDRKIKYDFKWDIFEWNDGINKYDEIQAICRNFQQKIKQKEQGYVAINHDFPCGGNRIIPETIVTAEIAEHAVTVNSIHTYPPFHIVHTYSTIKS
ncbi:MAG: DUF2617 family protein [bacterium]